jgi:hypothetical protein
MASIPTQEDFLAATRKSQEAMIAAIKTWLKTVRAATPRLTSVYERLPKLPPVSLPYADKLPTPEEAVDNAYHVAEQLLANQRKFAEDLLKAMAPLMPGRGEAAPEANAPREPKVPSQRVWQEAVAVSEPKPVAVSEPKPVAVTEPKPVAVSEPKPVAVSEPKPAAVSEPKPAEPKPAAASAEPKAAARPAAKSTAARPAPRTTAAASKSTTAKSTAAKSGAAKSTGGTSTPKRTSASRAPEGTDAS